MKKKNNLNVSVRYYVPMILGCLIERHVPDSLTLEYTFYSNPFLAYQAAEFRFCPRLFGIFVWSLWSELFVFYLAYTC